MLALSMYEDFKQSGFTSCSNYIDQVKLKELIVAELVSQPVNDFSDVVDSITKTLDKLDMNSMPDVVKKEVMLSCFQYIENNERILYRECKHSDIKFQSDSKFQSLYDIGKAYIDTLTATYINMEDSMRFLTKSYYVSKVTLVRNIINKVECICHIS